MAEISIYTFKRGISKDTNFSVPSSIEHWGIHVKYEGNTPIRMFYHADKTSLTDNSTYYMPSEEPWNPLSNKDKKVDRRILIGYSNNLTHEEMNKICFNVSKDRIFNTITNNCQEWVKSVLVELVKNKNLSQLCLDELKENKEIIPLLGW